MNQKDIKEKALRTVVGRYQDQIAAFKAESERIIAAVADFDARMGDIGSCGDGNCLVKRQTGMHTNGGCRCWQDKMIAQRFMLAARRLRNALASSQQDGDRTEPAPRQTGVEP